MIKILFSLLTFASFTFASNILSYNIYDRTDRVDVMLTFDTPYHGKIVKSRYNSKILLKLYNAKIESTKIKHLSSAFLKTLTITPMDGYTQIVATLPTQEIILKASKTADAYGLRLRFFKKSALSTAAGLKQQAGTSTQEKLFPNLPTKESQDVSTSYYVVVTLLVIAIIIMLILKRKMTRSASSPQQTSKSSWLFKGAVPKAPTMQSGTHTPKQSDDVSIRFQKRIDEKNSVIMLDFLEQSYLVLLGEHNNLLLERFHDNIPSTQDEFETLLQEKETTLNEFLQMEQKPSSSTQEMEDILKSFSKKASNIPYQE